MTLLELVIALALALTGVLVWDNLRAREAANEAIRAACERHGFLFLDDTVALASLRPVRDADGRVSLQRTFSFDYSDTGHRRRSGSVLLVGRAIDAVDLGVLEGGSPGA
jgi:hypothetical protein